MGTYPLPNGMNSWQENRLWGVVTIDGQTYSGPAIIDCGSPSSSVSASNFSGHKAVAQNSRIAIRVSENETAADIVGYDFVVDNKELGNDRFYQSASPRRHNIFGTPMFFTYDVFYDQVRGLIGLKKNNGKRLRLVV